MIKAIVFDFDGLIMDTETYEYYSFRDLLKEYGVELPLSQYSARIGGQSDSFDPYTYLQQQTGIAHDREQLREKRRDRFNLLFREEKALPGVEDCIKSAQRLGLKIGLASSAPKTWVLPFLKKLNLLECFACLRTNEDTKRVKPDPDLYIQVLDYFQVAPDEAIAFEDSPNGALAAIRAQMRCVIVPNKLTRRLEFPKEVHLRLKSLSDIEFDRLIQNM
ncbi:HAD family hydrolase [Paenibacillus sp. SI8]|uniref:HAD family hydrolase n=1 Tax=unclassified Paenibacillus TaxID=185978 RepID=UPI0034660BDB